jgi:Transglycosylase SLT domain
LAGGQGRAWCSCRAGVACGATILPVEPGQYRDRQLWRWDRPHGLGRTRHGGHGAGLPRETVETVRFGGFGAPLVNIVRGSASADSGLALFGAANAGELDRVAFAVDGAESGHGSNPAMWRPDLDGPQGPMQVSAAAALDVGGGDRFDLRQNRLLGRAFLAKMYQRYGNWPDAIAAYNWGPGNLDQWIANGRPADALPLETAHYLLKVLRDAFLLQTPRLQRAVR